MFKVKCKSLIYFYSYKESLSVKHWQACILLLTHQCSTFSAAHGVQRSKYDGGNVKLLFLSLINSW